MRDQFTFFSAPLPPTLWSSSLFHISFTGESLKKMSAAFCLGPPFCQASPPADDCDLMGALTQRSIHTAAQDLFLQCDLMNIIWAPVLCQAWHSTRNTHTHKYDLLLVLRDLKSLHPSSYIFKKQDLPFYTKLL